MTVGYHLREEPATMEIISRLEREIGRRIPDEYQEYLLRQDGGWLHNNDSAVQNIFGVGNVPDQASIWNLMQVYSGRVPDWLLPVADDAYGNLFALSLRPSDFGSVWFWDHEEEADEGEPPAEDNIELRAPGWSAFLDSLQPV